MNTQLASLVISVAILGANGVPATFNYREQGERTYSRAEDEQQICPEQGVLIQPHQTDCTKYYICAKGEPHEFPCAKGMFFDVALGDCSPKANCIMCNEDEGKMSIHALQNSNCKKYAVCAAGEKGEFECAEGALFSPVEFQCVRESTYVCPDKSKPDGVEPGQIPDGGDPGQTLNY